MRVPSVSLAFPPFLTFCFAQTLMLSRAIEGDILRGYTEIQGSIDSEHMRDESLSAERSALAERAKGLETRIAELEGGVVTYRRRCRRFAVFVPSLKQKSRLSDNCRTLWHGRRGGDGSLRRCRG